MIYWAIWDKPRVTVKIECNTRNFIGRIIFMSIFNDISWGPKDNKKECESSAQLVSLYATRFGAGQWSFFGLGSEKKWYSTSEDGPQGEWDRIARANDVDICRMPTPSIPIHESIIHWSAQKQRWWKICQYTISSTPERLKPFFAQWFPSISSVFTEQSQICAKNVTLVMSEQDDLLWQDNLTHFSCQVWRRHTYLWPMILHKEKDLLQRYEERFEKLSQQDRLSKFCVDAGFQNVVEIGQYFMTRDTEEFSQFTDSVACREYILPRGESVSDPKGWIRVNTKIGPVLEVATCCQQGKYGVWKSELSLWTRTILTRGSEFPMVQTSWSRIWTTMSRKPQFEDCALKSNACAFASRSKPKAKAQRRTSS